jgi:hypothetical protein
MKRRDNGSQFTAITFDATKRGNRGYSSSPFFPENSSAWRIVPARGVPQDAIQGVFIRRVALFQVEGQWFFRRRKCFALELFTRGDKASFPDTF